LDANQYSLILATALISITLNPFMFKLLPFFEKLLHAVPGIWKKLDSNKSIVEIQEDQLAGHVVVIGFGKVGAHLVDVLQSLHVPLLVIEDDANQIEKLNTRHIATLYGDAANSEVITHAGLERARAVIVTLPEESSAFMVVSSVKQINPNIPIIVRAATREGVLHLGRLGANHIVHPELEGGLEIIYHTLLQLGYPLREVHEYAESVRHDGYDLEITSSDEHRSLRDLLFAAGSIDITWVQLSETSPLVGKTLLEADIRSHTGTSVIALIRSGTLFANPKSSTEFIPGDRVGLIGELEQIEHARDWLSAK
jgi:CPA2 family monovalent cation:H+ antiporter-2